MMMRFLLLVLLLFGAVGCTDTPNSVSREYRNTINEGLDAMMMVTSDQQAYRMDVRVFSTLSDRFAAINKRLVIVRSNRTKKEFIKEVYESDGVALYFSEIEVNKQRYTMELTRIKNLKNQYMDRERQRLKDLGEDPDTAKDSDACPNLVKLISKGFDPLREQLKSPALLDMVKQFNGWKVDEFGEWHKKMMERGGSVKPVEVQNAW